MKWSTALALALALVLFAITGLMAVYAGAPDVTLDQARARLQQEPYLYSLVKCSGLQPLTLAGAKIQWDYEYGLVHGLTTDAAWQGTYEARADEFAAALGCPPPLANGQLTLYGRTYAPFYSHIHYFAE